MSDNDVFYALLFGIIFGLIVGAFACEKKWKKDAIKHGVAEYVTDANLEM